jgi:hypothetical protein
VTKWNALSIRSILVGNCRVQDRDLLEVRNPRKDLVSPTVVLCFIVGLRSNLGSLLTPLVPWTKSIQMDVYRVSLLAVSHDDQGLVGPDHKIPKGILLQSPVPTGRDALTAQGRSLNIRIASQREESKNSFVPPTHFCCC